MTAGGHADIVLTALAVCAVRIDSALSTALDWVGVGVESRFALARGSIIGNLTGGIGSTGQVARHLLTLSVVACLCVRAL